MTNNSIFPEHKLYTAFALIETLSGIKMAEELFLEFSHIALKQIGHNVEQVKIKVTVEEEGIIHLPYDVKSVLMVADDEDLFNAWEQPEWIDGYVAYNRMGHGHKDLSPSVTEGMYNYVNFILTPPNIITVDASLEEENIYILTDAIIKDEEGLPMITFKQARAIAYYCLYLDTERKQFAGIQTVDPNNIRMKALNAMADARVSESITDNQIDEVMDAKVSFGRKTFNKKHTWS